MTPLTPRLGGPLQKPLLCDAAMADGRRFGDAHAELCAQDLIGRWPEALETDAVVRLAEVVGEVAAWQTHAATPPVAQKLDERARPQPMDEAIGRHLQHLQHVCHKPRLHLRVEEERLPVSRARRTPVRAVAELVSHPGDWEHRTLRSIQPSRVLARQIEDEWNLYENRVAARLVDHLLAYLARRLDELRKIQAIMEASHDHSGALSHTTFWRAQRIAALWSNSLESKTEEELSRTLKRLELAQRDLQNLLDAPLYPRIPRRQTVALSLKPTNILVNDPHYRKVAALWRAWVKYGHRHQETDQQRSTRRQREASAWDRFVLHLVVRGFTGLGWSVTPAPSGGWSLSKAGWASVRVTVDPAGLIRVTGDRVLRLMPLCADLSAADPAAVSQHLQTLDSPNSPLVIAHVGSTAQLDDVDRASGWTLGGRAALFGCSPWGIDSEERMARVLHGWLSRAAAPPYPVSTTVKALPAWQGRWGWLRRDGDHIVADRAPNAQEANTARTWSADKTRELEAQAQRAVAAKQPFDREPGKAVLALKAFIGAAERGLTDLDTCPVCGGRGEFKPRPGKEANGSDATWWATCSSCESEWGTRPCTGCRTRYRALQPHPGKLDVVATAAAMTLLEWPDKVLGRDQWAQPCQSGRTGQFRCPECGKCSSGACGRCEARAPQLP